MLRFRSARESSLYKVICRDRKLSGFLEQQPKVGFGREAPQGSIVSTKGSRSVEIRVRPLHSRFHKSKMAHQGRGSAAIAYPSRLANPQPLGARLIGTISIDRTPSKAGAWPGKGEGHGHRRMPAHCNTSNATSIAPCVSNIVRNSFGIPRNWGTKSLPHFSVTH
jgi:hypothetical protein